MAHASFWRNTTLERTTQTVMNRIRQIMGAARRLLMPRQPAAGEDVGVLDAIVNSAPIGISLTDLQGRFVRTNPAFQQMTGLGEAALRAETCETLIHPEDFPHYQALLHELLNGQRAAFRIVMRYRTQTGSVCWVRCTVSLLQERRTAPRYIVARTEDITEAGCGRSSCASGSSPSTCWWRA